MDILLQTQCRVIRDQSSIGSWLAVGDNDVAYLQTAPWTSYCRHNAGSAGTRAVLDHDWLLVTMMLLICRQLHGHIAADTMQGQQGPGTNLKHILCAPNSNFEIHFVLIFILTIQSDHKELTSQGMSKIATWFHQYFNVPDLIINSWSIC